MFKTKIYFLCVLLFALVNACSNANKKVTVVYNANIYTVNRSNSKAEAVAISDNRFIAVGSTADIIKAYPNAEKVDAKGKYIYPGIIDAHCHFTGYAMDKGSLELYSTKSFAEVLEAVKKYAKANPTGWIIGRGWDQNQWQTKEFPVNDSLNILFPDRPIYLDRIDGHAALCNEAALKLANITASTDIFGGTVFTKNNKPTGVLLDNAATAVNKIIPVDTKEEAIAAFERTQTECFALGLTGVVDCGVAHYIVDWVHEAQKTNKLKMRVGLMLADDSTNYAKYLQQKPSFGDKLNVLGYKIYSDGALGSRGAYLLDDYHDQKHHKGLLLKPLDSIRAIAEKLIQSPYQMCTHAIGDAGNREILKIYGDVLKQKNDRRWRIEHAQVVSKADVNTFGQYSIIPSIQPTHATSDMAWADKRLGAERVQTAYAYKNLIAQNGWAPFGTDFPVEYINPFYTFYSAVFRNDANASMPKGWQMENAVSREDALRGITLWAAKGSFEEKIKGSIEVGKLADFIIADTDLMTAPALQCKNTKVLQTWIGGEKVWEAKPTTKAQ
jgi:predicted amidohydrolase YtcJ